jgi:DHA1 family bicyclomycin/chloramphenicol resistance-like MFS transporter
VVGLMGNDEIALSIVMTAGVAIALLALLAVGTGEEAVEH